MKVFTGMLSDSMRYNLFSSVRNCVYLIESAEDYDPPVHVLIVGDGTHHIWSQESITKADEAILVNSIMDDEVNTHVQFALHPKITLSLFSEDEAKVLTLVKACAVPVDGWFDGPPAAEDPVEDPGS